jgi:hypothetical protein
MTETFETAGRELIRTCLKDLSDYEHVVKAIQSPAIRKLVESIIAQKTDQLADLKLITGIPEYASLTGMATDPSTTGNWADPESLLAAVADRENIFAAATRSLANQTDSEDQRNSLSACAERSRKFASWSKDHLDLLGLF